MAEDGTRCADPARPVDATRPAEPAPPVEYGGDPVCWLPRVCPECGLFADREPPTTCTRCGAAITVD